MPLKKSQRSLKNWTKQKWRTKSGKPSAKTGERYYLKKLLKLYLLQNMQLQLEPKEKELRKVNSL